MVVNGGWVGEDPEATNLGTWKSYAGAGAGGG